MIKISHKLLRELSMQKIWLQIDKRYTFEPVILPPLSSAVPSPWPPSRKGQQLSAPHLAALLLVALPLARSQ